MHFRLPSTKAQPPPVKRSHFRRHLSRYILIVIFAVLLIYFFLPPFSNIRVMGVVNGNLTPVGPIFLARIDQEMVSCDTRVQRDQPLVLVSNELLAGQYQQNRYDAERSIDLAKNESTNGVIAAQAAARSAKDAAQAALANYSRLAALYISTTKLAAVGAVGPAAVTVAHDQLLQARSQANAAIATEKQMALQVKQLKVAAKAKILAAQGQLKLQLAQQNSVDRRPLVAPVSGELLDCHAHLGEVVDAGNTLFKIFQPGKAYVTAFVPPTMVRQLRIHANAYVNIPGMGEIPAKVTSIQPEITKLPKLLTRYFWEQPQWTQYRVVRITFSNLSPSQRRRLLFGERVHVRIPLESWGKRVMEDF
ncbi:HlyD family secretion protein [Acidithiobacillus sp.]|uniref:HlyD family secretion protein n=1 Tax=Acidithiobacillus sp. TaxID=1872118 RepID=UPI003D034025